MIKKNKQAAPGYYIVYWGMLLAEITVGLKIFRYGLIFLLVLALIITLFSKKISTTEKRGFWLDMLLAPIGTLYELYVWLVRSKK